MTKTAKTKLTILADFLAKKVKPKWFDLDHWATPGFKEQKCGTTACAAGWATVAFPNQGLTLKQNGTGYLSIHYRRKPELNSLTAVACFFDIKENAALFLFNPQRYDHGKRTKRYVVARIRQMVKTQTFIEPTLDESGALLNPTDGTPTPVTKWKAKT